MQGQILDSKEFYAPLITPFEAQLAFGPEGAAPERYSLDFDALLAAPADGDASGDHLLCSCICAVVAACCLTSMPVQAQACCSRSLAFP